MYAFIITTQKPTRKGYVFNGWNTKKDGSGQEYAAGSRYSGTGVLTLYATWKEEMTGYSSNSLESGQYAVMYNSEGGQQVLDMPEEQTKEKGVDLTLSENVPTRKGYRFIEWNLYLIHI